MRADKTSFRAEVTLRRSDSKRRPRLMVVVRDVEELKAVEDRVRLAEKMEALGQLAGGIAHDFNNQIAGIGVYAEAIRQRSNDPTAVVSFAEGIITATRRASDVVGRLLAFARRHQEMREPVELHGLVREVGELLSHSVPNGVSVKLELGARSPEVLGDASLLQSALLNLGLNARDAILAGTGRGTIVLRSRDVADTPRVEGQDGAVAVEVCDDGVGMSEDVLSRLFQPFFTTKSEGTGMGLAVSYGTVRAHGGVIEVESTQGKGSVLRVLLPRYGSREQTGRVRLDAASGSMKRIQARVLLVESEPTVADSARRLLSHLGCQVVHVMDGDAALQTHRRAAAAFDFVLLDTSTGRVEGTRLIEGLRGTSPGLPVAVSADPTELEVIRHLVAEHGALFVPRPYRLGELSRVLVDGLKLEGSLAPISSERGAS